MHMALVFFNDTISRSHCGTLMHEDPEQLRRMVIADYAEADARAENEERWPGRKYEAVMFPVEVIAIRQAPRGLSGRIVGKEDE